MRLASTAAAPHRRRRQRRALPCVHRRCSPLNTCHSPHTTTPQQTFLLYVKADLENVESLAPAPGAHFCLDVQESAGSERRGGVYVHAGEKHELAGSRGEAHFVMKFDKASKHEAYLNVLDVKGVTRPVTAADSGKWVPVVAFECRGLEPVAYHPEEEWLATGAGGQRFEGVNLSDDWADYDEKLGDSVSVMAFESKFELLKGK